MPTQHQYFEKLLEACYHAQSQETDGIADWILQYEKLWRNESLPPEDVLKLDTNITKAKDLYLALKQQAKKPLHTPPYLIHEKTTQFIRFTNLKNDDLGFVPVVFEGVRSGFGALKALLMFSSLAKNPSKNLDRIISSCPGDTVKICTLSSARPTPQSRAPASSRFAVYSRPILAPRPHLNRLGIPPSLAPEPSFVTHEPLSVAEAGNAPLDASPDHCPPEDPAQDQTESSTVSPVNIGPFGDDCDDDDDDDEDLEEDQEEVQVAEVPYPRSDTVPSVVVQDNDKNDVESVCDSLGVPLSDFGSDCEIIETPSKRARTGSPPPVPA